MDNDGSALDLYMRALSSTRDQQTGAYEDPSKQPYGGKWSEPGVPHTGWHVVHYYKLEDRDQLCEMCERQTVMFVHVMRHDEYEGDLKVGCVCAGHMEGDLDGARKREIRYRNKSKRRDNWLMRFWRNSHRTGGQYLHTDGMVISVYPTADYWSARVIHRVSLYERNSSRRYKTAGEAKLAAFEVVMNWLEKKPWESAMRTKRPR